MSISLRTRKGQTMPQAKNGDTVKIHYTLKFDDGTVFETTIDHDPIEFTIGESQKIPGLEESVVGMSPGHWKTTKIAADEAHGPHREEMVLEVHRNEFPAHLEPQVGQRIQVSQPNGDKFIVTVTHASESRVTLDANHPMAGKDLTLDIHLIEIV